MHEDNVLQKKSYAFALRTISFCKELVDKQKEYILSKQLLRSGTSVGANIEEAVGGYSRKEFLSKLMIAYKEARESRYWIRLIRDSGYTSEEKAGGLLDDIEELCKILGKIRSTMQKGILHK